MQVKATQHMHHFRRQIWFSSWLMLSPRLLTRTPNVAQSNFSRFAVCLVYPFFILLHDTYFFFSLWLQWNRSSQVHVFTQDWSCFAHCLKMPPFLLLVRLLWVALSYVVLTLKSLTAVLRLEPLNISLACHVFDLVALVSPLFVADEALVSLFLPISNLFLHLRILVACIHLRQPSCRCVGHAGGLARVVFNSLCSALSQYAWCCSHCNWRHLSQSIKSCEGMFSLMPSCLILFSISSIICADIHDLIVRILLFIDPSTSQLILALRRLIKRACDIMSRTRNSHPTQHALQSTLYNHALFLLPLIGYYWICVLT